MKEFVKTTMMKYLNSGKNILKTSEEYNFFYNLAKDRETEERKIELIEVTQNQLNPKTYHCQILWSDNTVEPIGFNKIIDNIGKDNNIILEQKKKLDLSQSMRKAIQEQINEFRKGEKKICLNCKESNCEMHVDHVVKFKKLQDDFFIKYENIDIEIEDDNFFGGRKFIEDSKISNKWKKYHKKNAVLRILCKDCNLKLGSKDTY